MSISEWVEVQKLFARISEQEKGFLALKALYDEQAMRLTEVEIQLEQQRAQLAVIKTLPNGQQQARR